MKDKQHLGNEACDFCDFQCSPSDIYEHFKQTHQDIMAFWRPKPQIEEIEHDESNLSVKASRRRKNKLIENCRLCDYSNYSSEMRKHFIECHIGEKQFKCSLCDYTTNVKFQLGLHIDGVHKNILHSCLQCDFKTRWPTYLEKHTKST